MPSTTHETHAIKPPPVEKGWIWHYARFIERKGGENYFDLGCPDGRPAKISRPAGNVMDFACPVCSREVLCQIYVDRVPVIWVVREFDTIHDEGSSTTRMSLSPPESVQRLKQLAIEREQEMVAWNALDEKKKAELRELYFGKGFPLWLLKTIGPDSAIVRGVCLSRYMR